MPRTNIPITPLALDGGHVEIAGTAIVAADGGSIDVAGDTRGLVIKFLSTLAGAADITITAANDAHALRSPLGNIAVNLDATVPGTTDIAYVMVESSRFCQALPGRAAAPLVVRQVFIDYNVAQTGWVWAYRLPDGQ